MHRNFSLKYPAVIIALLMSVAVFVNNLAAQTRISSPYSIYGLGEIYFNNNFGTLGMGGVSLGLQSNTSVNYINPASYVAVDSNSFVFESIVFSHFYGQNTPEQKQFTNYTSLGNLSFAFPVYKWWASAFGLMPYSATGYKVVDQIEYDNIGMVNYTYEGQGGIHQIFWGNGFKIGKGLSLGINTSYLFGNYKDISTVSSDSANFYVSNQHRAVTVNGVMFNIGAQYKTSLPSNRELIIGVAGGNNTALHSDEALVQRIYLPGFTVPDTVLNYVNEQGKIVIPAYYALGFTLKINKNWMAGADFYNQNWQTFKFFNQALNLNNSYQIGLGTQYIPDSDIGVDFLTRMKYTAGLRYKQTYIFHNNNSVNEIGIGFGLSFRLRRNLSGMTLGFEWANRGSVENNNLREDLYRFNIGVNIHERWFIRSKFY
ncbi:MAG: hypothetical protein KGZ97_00670 [Bacteroidetes bacterium]|nr:hypothetical protein [Bacteroidota bacterium]